MFLFKVISCQNNQKNANILFMCFLQIGQCERDQPPEPSRLCQSVYKTMGPRIGPRMGPSKTSENVSPDGFFECTCSPLKTGDTCPDYAKDVE